MVKATTAIKTYNTLKAKHPDAIILFRNEGVYNLLQADATAAAKTLGITRYEEADAKIGIFFVAYFESFKLDTYLPQLIRAGHRVAIADYSPEK